MSRSRVVPTLTRGLCVPPLAAALLTACGLLTGPSDRIIALELELPAGDTVALTAGQTVQLHARAVTANGDSARGAVITWAILDTGTVGIELAEPSGTIVARLTGTWHVQALVDSIRSDPIVIVVRPGSATMLDLGGLADTLVAGAATTDTVTALDAYGNVATSYGGTVRFTSTDSTATLPANYAFAATDRGLHVFAPGVTLRAAGPQRVTVRDLADSALVAVRDVTVIP